MATDFNKKINETINLSYKLKKEFFRKTIHMTAAFVPYFYYFAESTVMAVLLSVTLLYFISEVLRSKNLYIPVITRITLIASREKDMNKFILGPITLSLGIFLALTFFDYRSAVIAIYALAFGDGVASLFGEIIGGWKIPFTFGKTLGGTSGCFVVLVIVYLACGLGIFQAVFLALIAALIEVFPTGDYDNLLIPVATGIIAQYLFL